MRLVIPTITFTLLVLHVCGDTVVSVDGSWSSSSISNAIAAAAPAAMITVQFQMGTYNFDQELRVPVSNFSVSAIKFSGLGGSDQTIIDCGCKSRCISLLGIPSVTISGLRLINGCSPNMRTNAVASFEINSRRRRDYLPVRRKGSGNIVVMRVQMEITNEGKIIIAQQQQQQMKTRNNNNIKASSYYDNFGGCILIRGCDSVTMNDVRVEGGRSLKGSGFAILDSGSVMANGVSAVFNGIQVTSSQSLWGGGGYIQNCSSVNIANSTFSNNLMKNSGTASVNGGGLYIYLSQRVVLGPYLAFSNNSLVGAGSGSVSTGGLLLDTCYAPMLVGPIVAKGNYLTGFGTMFSAGMQLSSCAYAQIVGPLEVMWNNMKAMGAGNAHCASMELFGCNNAVFRGRSIVSANNGIVALDVGNVYGAGMELYSCVNVTVDAEITVANNSISVLGKGLAVGGGCTNCIIKGNPSALVYNNTIVTVAAPITFTSPYVPPPLTNNTNHCASTVVSITQSSGTLNDGSWGNYSPNLNCAWLIYLVSPMDQALGAFQITMTMLDTEPNNDNVYIYDGPTSQSSMLGKYSGTLQNPQCTSGACFPLDKPFTSSMGAVLVVFNTNGQTNLNGFALNWTTVYADITTGFGNIVLGNTDLYPGYSNGGAVIAFLSSVYIYNTNFIANGATHPVTANGGAMVVISSTVNIMDSTFERNYVKSVIALGGGIAAITQSNVLCNNCHFSSNKAIGYADVCFFSSYWQFVLCGSVFGGGVASISESSVVLVNSLLDGDAAVCANPGIDCQNHGGALASIHPGSLISLISSKCTSAKLYCTSNDGSDSVVTCKRAIGGCAFADDGSLSIVQSDIVNNNASSNGIGGGIFSSSNAKISVDSSNIQGNFARQGGGLGLEGTSFSSIKNCTISSNTAISAGGGGIIVNQASVSVYSTSFSNNAASKASVLLSYNEDNTAVYTMINISVLAPPGSANLMIGKINFTANIGSSNTWLCTWPGTILTHDATSEFFSLSCDQCAPGTYSIGYASSDQMNRSCQPCPFGAKCLGSSATSDGLMTLGGYWGSADALGAVSFYPCPYGYCCQLQDICVYDHCEGGRAGRLCGSCPNGQGLKFFTEACGRNEDCTDAGWAGILIIVGALLFALFLLATSGRSGGASSFDNHANKSADGMMSVMLYYYQVLPLVKSTSWKHTLPSAVLAVQSVFTLTPSSGESNRAGLCIQPSMTSSQRLAIRMLLPIVVLGGLVLLYLVHWGLQTTRRIKNLKVRIPEVKTAIYLAASVRLGTIAYITLVLIPLQMVQCVWVDRKYVWWFDASIECYESWQVGGFTAVVILFPLPFGVIALMAKRWTSNEVLTTDWQRMVWNVLTNGFKLERRWWLGISLYRRFLLVLVFATITDSNWKGVAITILCVIFVSLSFIGKPYQSLYTQRLDSASLIMLSVLSASSAPQLGELQFGTPYGLSNEAAIEAVQFVLAMAPISIFACLKLMTIVRAVMDYYFALQQTRAKNTTIHIMKGGDGIRDSPNSTTDAWEEYELPEDDSTSKPIEWGFHDATLSDCQYC